MAAAPAVFKAVIFAEGGVVAVARPGCPVEGRVVLAVHILVADQDTQGRAGGKAPADTALKSPFILFLPGRGDLPGGPAQRQLLPDILLIHGDSGGQTVQNGPDGTAVAFPEKRNRQYIAVNIFHRSVITSLLLRTMSAAKTASSVKCPISSTLII